MDYGLDYVRDDNAAESIVKGRECTEKMLASAMAKAVAVGLLPKQAPGDEYLKNWSNMKAVIEAALTAST